MNGTLSSVSPSGYPMVWPRGFSHSNEMDTFGFYGHAVAGDDDLIAEQLQSIIDKIMVSD